MWGVGEGGGQDCGCVACVFGDLLLEESGVVERCCY